MVRKTKLRYQPMKRNTPSGRLAIFPEIRPKGALCFVMEAGHLASVSGCEEQTIHLADQMIGGAKTTVQIHLREREVVPRPLMKPLESQHAARAAAYPDGLPLHSLEGPSEGDILRAALGNGNTATVLAELRQAEQKLLQAASGGPAILPPALFMKVKALISLHPESCDALLPLLCEAAPESPLLSGITGALIVVGHPHAQRTVALAVRTRRDAPTRELLAAALGMVASPTLATEAALWELTVAPESEVAAAATLALGRLAAVQQPSAPHRAARLVARLAARLKTAPTGHLARACLLALGGTGLSRALPPLTAWLAAPTTELRVTAATALARIPGAKPALIRARKDREPVVRAAVVIALGQQAADGTTLRILKQALLREPVAEVRLAAVEALAPLRSRHPAVRGWLEQTASNDPDPQLRQRVCRLLGRPPQ